MSPIDRVSSEFNNTDSGIGETVSIVELSDNETIWALDNDGKPIFWGVVWSPGVVTLEV